MKRVLLIACFCSIPLSHTFSQINKADTILAAASEIADYILYQNHDSSYIKSYADKVSVKILALNKFNTFHLWDQSLDGSISYRPDLGVNFGVGAAYKWFALDADSTLIPSDSAISVTSQSNFLALNMVSLTMDFGYMYSFVIKGRFFITLGLIPGIGIKNGDYRTENLVPINSSLAMRVKTMNAIGYNGQRFYTGFQLISNFYYMPLDKDLKSGISEGRTGLFIGYRF